MTIGKPGAFIMGDLVAQLRRPKQWCCIFEHEGVMRHGTSDAPFKAANVLTALEGAAKYALDVIGSTNRFDAEQCKAAADKLSAALSLLRGGGK